MIFKVVILKRNFANINDYRLFSLQKPLLKLQPYKTLESHLKLEIIKCNIYKKFST